MNPNCRYPCQLDRAIHKDSHKYLHHCAVMDACKPVMDIQTHNMGSVWILDQCLRQPVIRRIRWTQCLDSSLLLLPHGEGLGTSCLFTPLGSVKGVIWLLFLNFQYSFYFLSYFKLLSLTMYECLLDLCPFDSSVVQSIRYKVINISKITYVTFQTKAAANFADFLSRSLILQQMKNWQRRGR